MMSNVNKSRREALKKLGIGTGVAWAAPAVTVLVVPTHAQATSSSASTGLNGSELVTSIMTRTEYTPNKIGINISSTSDLTGLTGTVVTPGGTIAIAQSGNPSPVRPSGERIFDFLSTAAVSSFPTSGSTPTVTVSGTTIAYKAGVSYF